MFLNVLKKVSVILFIATTFLYGTSTNAQDGNAEAREAYMIARDLFEAGEYSAASLEFRRAYSMMPSWKILYNIGQCEAASKRYGMALEALQEYLVKGGDDIEVEREEQVISEIEKLKIKTGSIKVIAPDGSTVVIGEFERGVTPLPGRIKVSAGVLHKLVVSKDDIVLLERQIRVDSEETITVDATPAAPVAAPVVEPVVAPVEPQPVVTEPKEEPVVTSTEDNTEPVNVTPVEPKNEAPVFVNKLKAPGIILTSLGLATVAGGVVTGIIAIKKNKKLESSCGDDMHCDPDMEDVKSEGKTMGTVSTILVSAGGAMALTGVILLIAGKKRTKESLATSFNPVLSPSLLGLQLSTTF